MLAFTSTISGELLRTLVWVLLHFHCVHSSVSVVSIVLRHQFLVSVREFYMICICINLMCS
jgi:hypothetical protein